MPGPFQLPAIVLATQKLMQYTGAELALTTLIKEDIAASLDASIFSNAPASALRPPGILWGVVPLTPSAETDLESAALADLQALARAVIDAGGNGDNLAFVASTRQTKFLQLYLGQDRAVTVWATPTLADGTVICLQTDAFASTFAADPEISMTEEATLQTSDPATGLMTGKTLSLFKQGLTGIKIVLPCAWCLRGPLVSFVTGVSWGLAPESKSLQPLSRQVKLGPIAPEVSRDEA